MADRSVVVRLKASITDFQAGMRTAGASVDDMQRKLRDGDATTKRNLQQVSRGMMLVGAAGVAAAGLAVKAFADFDQEMSNVKAVAGATAGEMDKLRDAAMKAGADTVFSASEAAKAEAELAKAGVKTADILGGALRGSLDLAAAGQLDLADAAVVAAQAMNIFKLRGSEVTHIADVLAAGANKSAADVKTLGDALRQGGLVAAQTGLDLEDTVGALSAFADSALVGSDAGTSLKTMLQRLVPEGAKAQSAMEQIGFSAYDAQGNFVGLEAVAGQLQEGLGRLSEEQRTATMRTIFGSDAVRAASVLYELGASGVREYTDAVNDQGAAARNAATQLDNLGGDLEALKGSLETALIGAGSGANGFLRGVTQGLTGAINKFNALPQAAQGSVTAIAGIGGAALTAVGGLGYLVPKVQEGRRALRDLGTAGAMADRNLGRLGKLGAYGAIAATAAVGFNVLTEQIEKLTGNGPADVAQLTNALTKLTDEGKASGEAARLFGQDLDGLNAAVRDASRPLADLQTGFGLLPSRVGTARDKLSDLDDALASLVSGGNAAEAKRQFDLLADRLPAGKVEFFRDSLDGYASALAGADTQASLAADSADEFGGAVDAVSPVIEEATDVIDDYKNALDSLNGINIDAARSQLDLANAFKDASDAVEKGAKVTRDETGALLDLAEQANETSKSIADQTQDQNKANASLRESRRRFIETAVEMGHTREEARKLADQWLSIPTKRQTKYSTPGVDGAISDLERVRRAVLDIPSQRSVAVTVNTVNKLGANPELRASGGPVRKDGSYIVGEQGPELFVPTTPGMIVPAGRTAAMLASTPLAAGSYGGTSGGGGARIELNVENHTEPMTEFLPRTLENAMYRIGG